MILIDEKIEFLIFWERKGFLNYFGFWSYKFLRRQILSSEKYLKKF